MAEFDDPSARPSAPPSDTLPPDLAVPVSSPTFNTDAESLLRNLKLARAAAPSPDGALPAVSGYEVLAEIGHGGMGVVYRARQIELDRLVALKMIRHSANADPGEVRRFVAEAAAVAAVKHPNVVQLYELGGSQGRPYFAMELVEGGSLAQLIADGPLDPRRAAAVLAAVCDGVQAAHDAGVVHRDLKPGNILLHGPGAVPKVSDFGLAKRLSADLTRTQAVLGTPEYMAPEQAGAAKFVGPAADVYALGAVLYRCLTGAPPIRAADALELVAQLKTAAPVPPGRLRAGVPRDLELICLKCLEKEPHDRYPSAEALADDLRRFLRGEPVRVRPIGPLRRAARWAWRNPVRAAVGALAAALVVAVPPLAIWQQARFDRNADEARWAGEREAEAAKFARAQRLFALLTAMRTREAARPPGWTAATRAELPEAVGLAGGDARARAELRGLAARAVFAPDVLPMDPAQPGFSASALATCPKTGLVAAGRYLDWLELTVRLIDPETGRTARALAVPAASLALGAPDHVRALAFAPDGARLFVGTRSGRVARLDLAPGAPKKPVEWKADRGAITRLAVAPDGRTVYALGTRLSAWSADAGTEVRLPAGGPCDGVAVLPGGGVLAADGARLHHWSAAHEPLRAADGPGGSGLAVASGALALRGNRGRVEYVSVAALAARDALADPELRHSAHESTVRTIAVHPSGAFAATAGADADRTVKVWALASCRLVAAVPVPGTGPIALAWSGDGRVLVATSNGPVGAGFLARWRFVAPGAQRLACLSAHELEAAAPLPGGRAAALAAADGTRELLHETEPGTAAAAVLADSGGDGRGGLADAPGGALVAALERPALVRLAPGAPPAEFGAKVGHRFPRVAPDGTVWAVADAHDVRAFAPGGAPLRHWSNAAERTLSGLASLDALDTGRTVVLAGGRNGTVHQLVAATGARVHVYPRAGDPVQAVALAPDEALAAVGTQKGFLRAVRPGARAEGPAVEAHPSGVAAVAFDRTGALLATGGRDRTVRLWARAGERFEPLFAVANLPGPVLQLRFAPDADALVVLLAHEHAVRLWDVAALRRELAALALDW